MDVSLGLKRGTVKLLPHQEQWCIMANDTIATLQSLLGDICIDIQHIGSTAIRGIFSKPIIDIAVGVSELNSIKPYIDFLGQNGIIFRNEDVQGQLLFVIADLKNDIVTHHVHVVHVVIWNSKAWHNYINFRDYLNTFPEQAIEYERLKMKLALEFASDRVSYTMAKQKLIDTILKQAQAWRVQNNN